LCVSQALIVGGQSQIERAALGLEGDGGFDDGGGFFRVAGLIEAVGETDDGLVFRRRGDGGLRVELNNLVVGLLAEVEIDQSSAG